MYAWIWRKLPFDGDSPVTIALTYDEEVGCKGVPRLLDHLVARLPAGSHLIATEVASPASPSTETRAR